MSYQFVNLWQTADERKRKYWLLRSIGLSSAWARHGRDLRMSTIERFYGSKLGIKGKQPSLPLQS